MDADDITDRIMKTAVGFERWTVVTPSMFQDVMDDEMRKYDKFIQEMKDSETNQQTLLEQITVRIFIASSYEPNDSSYFHLRRCVTRHS
jgi:programmed cell death 6-interacting protein